MVIKLVSATTPTLALCLVGTFCLLATACTVGPDDGEAPGSLIVFAAASLTDAFSELGLAFELQNPRATVAFNFAGSQRLRTQLEHGAQADIFASADWQQMKAIQALSLTSGEPSTFAANRLVIITPMGGLHENIISTNELRIDTINAFGTDADKQVLHYLATPGIKLVLALEQVPVGDYSREVIRNIGADPQFDASYAQKVLANVVSEETNVRDVVQKVAMGEADAGVVYLTNAMASAVKERTDYFTIPERFNVTATYPISVLATSSEPGLAWDFINFLRSEQGLGILARNGFLNPIE